MKTNRERAEEAYRQVREFPYVASRAVAIIEMALDEAVREAVAEERGACAKLIEDRTPFVFGSGSGRGLPDYYATVRMLIDDIRARGAK